MDECGRKPSAVLERAKYIEWQMCKKGAKSSPGMGERNSNKENAFMPSYDKKRS